MGIIEGLTGCLESMVKGGVNATHDWSDHRDGERVEVEMPDGTTQPGNNTRR